MEDFGRKVAYFRKAKGISIKKLAEDLCDESTIYRLEKGKQLPRLEIVSEICQKLEIPFKALFPFNEEIEDLKKKCREFTYVADYLSLELIIEESERVLNELNSTYSKLEFKKFIMWHRAILLHKKEHRVDDALTTLNSLVSLKNYSSELDISIVNSIGLIYLAKGNYKEALHIYKDLYAIVKNRVIIEDYTLLPRIGYNYSNSLFKMGMYKEGLLIGKEVLFYLKTNNLMYSLGETYHLIGVLSKKNGDLKDAEEAFNQALLVFMFTGNNLNVSRTKKDLNNLSK